MSEESNKRIRVHLRPSPNEDVYKCRHSICLLPISVGQPHHEGLEFHETLKMVNYRFQECHILIADSLQRYNLPFLHNHI